MSKSEYGVFNSAMDTILKADPAKVKAEMEAEKQLRAEARSRKARKDEHLQNAVAAFKKAARAMKDNPKLQVPY
jgi:hypothetical protein